MSTHEHDGYSGAGRYPGSHKPVRRAPGPPVARELGESELPSVLYAPTARSKFRELRAELCALEVTIERGKPNASDPVEIARIEGILDGLRLGASRLGEAYTLGQDSKSVAPTLRFCPECPKGKTPLGKNRQFCPTHSGARRKIQNRLAQRRFKEKHKKISKVSKLS